MISLNVFLFYTISILQFKKNSILFFQKCFLKDYILWLYDCFPQSTKKHVWEWNQLGFQARRFYTTMKSDWNHVQNVEKFKSCSRLFWSIWDFIQSFFVIDGPWPSETHSRQVGNFEIKFQTNLPFLDLSQGQDFFPHFSDVTMSWSSLKFVLQSPYTLSRQDSQNKNIFYCIHYVHLSQFASMSSKFLQLKNYNILF